jgi:hypothetical protein
MKWLTEYSGLRATIASRPDVVAEHCGLPGIDALDETGIV